VGRPVREEYLDATQARGALLAAGREEWHAADTVEICQTASALVTDCVPAMLGRAAHDVSEVVRTLLGPG